MTFRVGLAGDAGTEAAVDAPVRPAGWLARLRALRRETLGMNRRNLTFLVPYNAQPLFALVDQKEATKRVLAAAGIPVPETYVELAVVWDVRRLGRILAGRSTFVIKPGRGSGGGGVLVIAGRRDRGFVKASGAFMPVGELEGHCADVLAGAFSRSQRTDSALIEHRVEPDRVLGAISYRGVPDVRVLVFRGVPVQAMIRLPTAASDGRANLHMGGMAVGVDLATGVTTHGSLGRRPCSEHPDLGRSVVGLRVPQWRTILELAARCYDAVPLGYLGVDIVLDAERGPLVLELNARPGLTIQLANRRGLRPLLEAVAGLETTPLAARERVRLGVGLAASGRATGVAGAPDRRRVSRPAADRGALTHGGNGVAGREADERHPEHPDFP